MFVGCALATSILTTLVPYLLMSTADSTSFTSILSKSLNGYAQNLAFQKAEILCI